VIDMAFSTSRPTTAPTGTVSVSAEPAAVPLRLTRFGRGVDDQPVADLSLAPLPSRGTLRRRRSLPRQALRFAAFNARIMRMVLRGHHTR